MRGNIGRETHRGRENVELEERVCKSVGTCLYASASLLMQKLHEHRLLSRSLLSLVAEQLHRHTSSICADKIVSLSRILRMEVQREIAQASEGGKGLILREASPLSVALKVPSERCRQTSLTWLQAYRVDPCDLRRRHPPGENREFCSDLHALCLVSGIGCPETLSSDPNRNRGSRT